MSRSPDPLADPLVQVPKEELPKACRLCDWSGDKSALWKARGTKSHG